MVDFRHCCLQVCDVAREAGQLIRNERKTFSPDKIEVKGLHDFVSYVDKAAERLAVTRLKEILPEAGFITEEQTVAEDSSPLKWVVDPLDGTTNFIHGMFPCAVSIALMVEGEVVIGVVYEVGHDECFYAWKDGKAMLNGSEIRVSQASTLDSCLIGTGFPYYDFSKLDAYFNCLRYFSEHTHGMRRLGTAATDLAYVACGRLDAFFEYSLRPWDVAAGAFIVQQAGGCVCDFSGGSGYLFGGEMVATNASVYSDFMSIVKKHFSR